MKKSQLTFIKKVFTADTGGGTMVDYIELKNGKVIGVTDEVAAAYACYDDTEDGQPYAHFALCSPLVNVGEDLFNIINQEGEAKTDGQCLDEVIAYLIKNGLYGNRDDVREPADTTVADHMAKRALERQPIFLAKCNDGSGRKPSQLPESQIRETWDLQEEGESGENLEDWMETADVGDTWTAGTESLERIS